MQVLSNFLIGFLNLMSGLLSLAMGHDMPKLQGLEPPTFTAAVYEHIPVMATIKDHIYSRPKALEVMKKNLETFRLQTEKAKDQGAQIIVFPENGIHGLGLNRTSILHFLENIPDPKVTTWSPCSDPTRYPNTEVQHALSCMAKENDLYVVANMGDLIPCNGKLDPKCPSDGRYQYNTDVAFGPDGTLLAKYHKTHLFFESQFDTPEPKVVYFDTPFGRFGMLVCFDLMFKEPAVTMVTEHYNITNIAFPTAWMDALPLLSAIGYHSSFARRLGVNFLSANIHGPAFRFQGSGIFTPNGMADFYYDNDPLSPGKLVVSTIDVVKPLVKRGKYLSYKYNTVNSLSNDSVKTGDSFPSELFGDLFTFKVLEDTSGNLSVCQGNVCCSLTYSLSNESWSNEELFAFGVFDGLHTLEGQYYFQICVLVKCEDKKDRNSCGKPSKVSSTKFKSISISGHFQTKFIYPQIIMSKNGQLLLGDQKSWSFNGDTMTSGAGLNQPLITAALFGRFYCRDGGVSRCDLSDDLFL